MADPAVKKKAGGRAPVAAADGATAPTHYVLERQVGHLLRKAHQRHTAIFAREIDEAKLTPTQYAALVKIFDLGEVSQNRLGRLTAMDPATVQGVIRRLQARNLVVRSADPENKLRRILRLTEEGVALVRRAIPLGRKISEATLAPLEEAERKVLLDLLERLG